MGGFVLDFGGIVKRDLGTEVVKLLLGLGVKILQPAVQLDEERKVWNLGKFNEESENSTKHSASLIHLKQNKTKNNNKE